MFQYFNNLKQNNLHGTKKCAIAMSHLKNNCI
jgi:hypothetical protein